MRKENGGMGFRNLYGFNLAMLRKQGWRLETNQDTIVSKVFKARYFPMGDFVDAKLGHNSSFIWRSIHASQVVVRGSLRWRVGDGSKIRVWYDPWIKDEGRSYVTTAVPMGKGGLVVRDLIDSNGKVWREDEVKTMFNEKDAKNILAMPLIDEVSADKQFWQFTTHGNYNVNSAYHYVMEHLVNNRGWRMEGSWLKLWRLKIPQKVKVFLWRAARECLPTRCRLQTRGVHCSDRCVHCNSSFENDWHVFFGCEKLEPVWSAAYLWHVIRENLEIADRFVSLFFQLLDFLQHEQLLSFVMTLWCIWKRRNDKLWNDIETQPRISLQTAREVLLQWQQVRDSQGRRTQDNHRTIDL